MTIIPNLSGVANPEDVSSINAGGFSKDYINWARVMQYIRENAPDWMPYFERNVEGGIELRAPDGSHYLLIGFQHVETGLKLPPIPHGQDLGKNPSGRDIADAGMRGVCKCAALQLGLAWSMWSKDDPMEREKAALPLDEKAFMDELYSIEDADEIKDFVEKHKFQLRVLPKDTQDSMREAIKTHRDAVSTQK